MSDFILYVIGFMIFLMIDGLLLACLYYSEHGALSSLFIIMLFVYNGLCLITLMLYLLRPSWIKKLRKFT